MASNKEHDETATGGPTTQRPVMTRSMPPKPDTEAHKKAVGEIEKELERIRKRRVGGESMAVRGEGTFGKQRPNKAPIAV